MEFTIEPKTNEWNETILRHIKQKEGKNHTTDRQTKRTTKNKNKGTKRMKEQNVT